MRRFLAFLLVVLTVTCTGGAAYAQYGGSGNVPGGTIPADEVLGDEVSRDEVVVDEVLADEVLADEVLADEVSRGPTAPARPVGGGAEVLGISISRGSLVRTGQELLPYVLASASLIGLGAALVVTSRRRGIVTTAS